MEPDLSQLKGPIEDLDTQWLALIGEQAVAIAKRHSPSEETDFFNWLRNVEQKSVRAIEDEARESDEEDSNYYGGEG